MILSAWLATSRQNRWPPPDVSRPADRRDEGELLPPAGRCEGRGRWPDDEAIFDLSQPVSHPHPSLAPSKAPRWR